MRAPAIALLALSLSSCTSPAMPELPPSPTPASSGSPSAPAGPALPLLSTEATPDSPKAPSAAWRGVLAKVPETASLLAAARTPPCLRVFYRIPRPQWPKGQGFVLVLLDPTTKQERRFPIGVQESSPAAPEPKVDLPPVDPRVAERLVHEGYLNIHVLGTIAPPPVAGSYLLRVDLGPIRSPELPFRLTP